jgi:hypothetical protein
MKKKTGFTGMNRIFSYFYLFHLVNLVNPVQLCFYRKRPKAKIGKGGLSMRRLGGLPGDLHGCAPDPLASAHLQLRHSFLNPLSLLRASKGDKENFTENGPKRKSVTAYRKRLKAEIGRCPFFTHRLSWQSWTLNPADARSLREKTAPLIIDVRS